jgi:hypothetical protein
MSDIVNIDEQYDLHLRACDGDLQVLLQLLSGEHSADVPYSLRMPMLMRAAEEAAKANLITEEVREKVVSGCKKILDTLPKNEEEGNSSDD